MRDLVFNEFWFPLEGLARETLCRVALTKLASAMAAALRRRGVPDLAASLAAEVGAITFGTAYARWLSEPDEYDEQTCRCSFERHSAISRLSSWAHDPS